MPTLHYGLNLTKKRGPGTEKPGNQKRNLGFEDDSEDDNQVNQDDNLESIGHYGSLSSPSNVENHPQKGASPRHAPPKKTGLVSPFTDLSSNHSARKHATSAQDVDPSVYDYDAVYDSLHAKPKKASSNQGPKYMQNLLQAAEVRKRDQLLAKEKMLAKEREAEGEEFADKEKFVTGAYKTQQEEVRRQEEEEKEREAEAAKRKRLGGHGMNGLYKDLLEREEARHEAIAKSIHEGSRAGTGDEEGNETNKAEHAQNPDILINDNGEVVDKRQLLKAGLNVASKPKKKNGISTTAEAPIRNSNMAYVQGKAGSKMSMRERQSRMLETQLEETVKRAADEERDEQEALRRAAKSRKTETEVKSAKERYLQRKRDAEAEQAAKAAASGK